MSKLSDKLYKLGTEAKGSNDWNTDGPLYCAWCVIEGIENKSSEQVEKYLARGARTKLPDHMKRAGIDN